MAVAKLNDVAPILDVRNIDRAIKYYVERLGFQLDLRYANDPTNYAGVRRDLVCLHMQWQEEEHFKSGTAGRLRVRIVVDSPDNLFDEYRSKGVFDDNSLTMVLLLMSEKGPGDPSHVSTAWAQTIETSATTSEIRRARELQLKPARSTAAH